MFLIITPLFRIVSSIVVLFACGLFSCLVEAQLPNDYCSQKFFFGTSESEGWLPVCANITLATPEPLLSNASIDTLVVAIHGIGGAAPQMFTEVDAVFGAIPSRKDTTLVIAPQFHEESTIGNTIPEGVLFWKSFPFWGNTDEGLIGTTRIPVARTPFNVTDLLLSKIIEGGSFPNIKEILIVGFSGGAQFVQRYVGVNRVLARFSSERAISSRFLVSSPSSYLYFDTARPVSGSTTLFEVPDSTAVAGCPEYNSYGTGLDKLTIQPYVSQITASEIKNQYIASPILYLVGELDNNPLDPSLDKNCYAMIQGINRLERAQAFLNHLPESFGTEILNNQEFGVVSQAGHNLAQMIRSQQAMTFFEIRSVVIQPTPVSEITPVITPVVIPTIEATPFFGGVAPRNASELRSQVRTINKHLIKMRKSLVPLSEMADIIVALDVILASDPGKALARERKKSLKGAIRKCRRLAPANVATNRKALKSIRGFLRKTL